MTVGNSAKAKGFRAYFRRREFRLEIAVLLVSALAARAAVYRDVSPFGIAALVAAGMAGWNIHYAFAGTVLGCCALQWPPAYPSLAACTLYYLLYFGWTKWKNNCGKFEKLILLFLAQTSMIPVFCRNDMEAVLRGFIGLGVSVLSSLMMQNALRAFRTLGRRHVLTDGEQLSISALFGVILMSVSDVCAFGFSLSVAMLLFFSMTASMARGISGVAVSVALAVVLSVGGEFSLAFVGGIAACTLAGAALRSMDAMGVIGGFVSCSLLLGTYVYTASHTINLLNLAAAGAAFLVIPKETMLKICAYLDADKNRERYARRAMKRMRDCTSAELKRTAEVVQQMAALYGKSDDEPDRANTLQQWTAQAAASVCADCVLKKICWRDWTRASEAVTQLLASQERGERIRIRRPFEPSCRNMQQMAAAAWQSQNQYLVQQAMKKRVADQNAFVFRQLSGVRDIILRQAQQIVRDKWLDEELEQLLLRGLDRRGYRVYGVDAFFPEGKLQVQIRLPSTILYETEGLCDDLSQILRRPIRILHADLDGKQCTLHLEESQALTATMGTASCAISKTGINGDSAGERRMERGRVLYAISDGMGAGAQARGESDAALRLLFDLYDAGVTRDTALESVNRLLLGGGEDMYATLDAVYLDLRSGDAEFMKYGAPPSFVFRQGKVHTVCAEALPVGILHEAVPAIAKAQLKRNDAVILFSDGALDALGEQTAPSISTVLQRAGNSQEAAEQLLKAAAERKLEDDMTVMVIRIA